MSLEQWVNAALNAIAFTMLVWFAWHIFSWIVAGPNQQVHANWVVVWFAYLIGVWSGRTGKAAS